MALKPFPNWNDPGTIDALKGLLNCQDDNSYYAAVKGFSQYVSEVQDKFESLFPNIIRLQNLTPETASMYNNTGCHDAKAGPSCVVQGMQGVPLNPNLTQFQLFCLNECADPATVMSGGWEQAGDKIRNMFLDLWKKFQESQPG